MHGQQFAGGAFEHVFGVGDRLEHSRPEPGQLRMPFRDVLPSLRRQPHPHPVSRPRRRWFIVALLRVRDHGGIFSLARKKCTCVLSCGKSPAGTKLVPRIGRLLPMVAALPIGTFEPAFGASCAIVLTRSMRAARRWTEKQRRGTERAGLVASSSARAAQAPRDRHSGEHRPGALVPEPRERHPLAALSRRRSDGVSGAGAGTRLDEKSRGTPTYAGRATTGVITVFVGRSGRM
jgi:hypothetical protein